MKDLGGPQPKFLLLREKKPAQARDFRDEKPLGEEEKEQKGGKPTPFEHEDP